MKTLVKFCGVAVLSIVSMMCASSSHADQQVYANTNAFQTQLSVGSLEVGNEITLAPGARNITGFAFQYYLPVATGNEMAEVKFYANDSALTFAGYTAPGTVLYDSGLFPIVATTGATVNFGVTDLTFGVPVPLSSSAPDTFTFTVQFSGLTVGEDVGVDLYNPVTVGSAPADMWENMGGSWSLVTNSSVALRIAADVEAVPEPTSVMFLALAGALGFVGFVVRRNLSAAR